MLTDWGRAVSMRLFVAVILSVCAMGIVAGALAVNANAYIHTWSCYRYSTNDCSDTTGTIYNPWLEVYTTSGYSVYHICAEGVTSATISARQSMVLSATSTRLFAIAV